MDPRRCLIAVAAAVLASLAPASVAGAGTPRIMSLELTPIDPQTGADVALRALLFGDATTVPPFAWAWDLDGTGAFDGPSGAGFDATITHAFATGGLHPIAVRVRDAAGAETIGRDTVVTHPGNWPPQVIIQPVLMRAQTGRPVQFGATVRDDRITGITPLFNHATTTLPVAWQVDGVAVAGASSNGLLTYTFDVPGRHTLTAAAVDADGAAGSDSIVVDAHQGNEPPTVRLSVWPAQPRAGGSARVTANVEDDVSSVDPQTGALRSPGYAWDVDGDGFDDGAFAGVQVPLLDTSPRTVRVKVTDVDGAETIEQRTIVPHEGNVAPDPDTMVMFPERARPFQTVFITWTGTDDQQSLPAAPPPTLEWDLDDDGAFDDATGGSTHVAFLREGTFPIRVRATDADGVSAVATKTVTVADAAPVGGGESPVAPAPVPEPTPTPPASAPPTGPPAPAAVDLVVLDSSPRAHPRIDLRRGVLTLGRVRAQRDVLVRARVTGPRGLRLGTAMLSLRAGRSATLSIRLSRGARRALARSRRVRLLARISVRDGAGGAQELSRRLTLRVRR